ncbi:MULTISPECIES: head-tail connector protein [Bacillus]|uniref:head-tail connector protein n=1 Tax=Bacillus TaxID=1386 RepID=UPI000BFB36B2|nr:MULTISPECIES: head-tail connector protein [Bacillus cereus group]MDA2320287.1 head-tail connector protein [Bacillus cereus group sp. Bc177]PGS04848.1 DNA-packaging protein [Bacillus cereus]HDR8172023.1 DNA-packaging protein [Bacillus thuringiensis]
MMLEVVKKALRVSHNALDDEIDDLIEAARTDLKLSGVSGFKSNDDTDPLIKRAIIMYTKANFISNAKESERFQLSYNMLKNHLTLAGDYK